MRISKVGCTFTPYSIAIHIDTEKDREALLEAMSALRTALRNLGPLTGHEYSLREIAINMANNITRRVGK